MHGVTTGFARTRLAGFLQALHSFTVGDCDLAFAARFSVVTAWAQKKVEHLHSALIHF
jgi:hypothetical protein